jgi:branched-chain amino acid transport system ATP-binding protein
VSASGVAAATLRLEGVSVPRAGRTVVRDVSFQIAPGEVTTLLGANGAGKSTLVLAVAGLLRPSAGRVLLGDRDLTNRAPERIRAAGVAVVPEGRRLLAGLTVEDNLRVATYALSRAQRQAGIAYALELFPELESRWHAPARLLSGGEQQRLAVARALSLEPDVLFLDEPTANLDPASTLAIEQLIQQAHDAGTKIVLVTHDIGQARRLADEVLFLYRGQLEEQSPASRFFEAPASAAARAFLEGRLVL